MRPSALCCGTDRLSGQQLCLRNEACSLGAGVERGVRALVLSMHGINLYETSSLNCLLQTLKLCNRPVGQGCLQVAMHSPGKTAHW